MIKLEQIKDFPEREKFLVNYCGTQLKAYREKENNLFILAKGRSRYGYRVGANSEGIFNNVELVKLPLTKEDKNKKWYKSLKRAVKLMEESGLWTNIKEVYENILKNNFTLEDRQKIRDIDSYDNRNEIIDFCKSNGYGFMIYKDKEGKECLNGDYIWEISRCDLKSMYFGRSNTWYKERIQKALKDKTPLSLSETVNYDVSFEYNPEINKAWYSEEYRGCGNGHYYLALNHNTALFYEND